RDLLPRSVAAAVVDEEDFQVEPGRLRDGRELCVQRSQALRLVVNRDDDRNHDASSGPLSLVPCPLPPIGGNGQRTKYSTAASTRRACRAARRQGWLPGRASRPRSAAVLRRARPRGAAAAPRPGRGTAATGGVQAS